MVSIAVTQPVYAEIVPSASASAAEHAVPPCSGSSPDRRLTMKLKYKQSAVALAAVPGLAATRIDGGGAAQVQQRGRLVPMT